MPNTDVSQGYRLLVYLVTIVDVILVSVKTTLLIKTGPIQEKIRMSFTFTTARGRFGNLISYVLVTLVTARYSSETMLQVNSQCKLFGQ